MAENGKTVTVTDGNFTTEIEGHNGLSLVDFRAVGRLGMEMLSVEC